MAPAARQWPPITTGAATRATTVAPGAPLSDVEAIGELRTALGLFPGADAEAVVQAVHSLLLRVDALEVVVAEHRGELG